MIATTPAVEHDTEIDLVTRFFQLLADPTRVRIIEFLLQEGEKNVSELVHHLGVPQARVSSHLGCLRWCGYVGSRRDGKFIYYRIIDPRVSELMDLSRTIMADNAGAIASCLRLSQENG